MLVAAPPGPAIDWILSTVLTDWLGLEFERETETSRHYVLELDGRRLVLPDVFFAAASDNWLGTDTLPRLPLSVWDTREFSADIPLIGSRIPVLFGQPGFGVDETGDSHINVDIFGSAFFMLSRYEEAVIGTRDRHQRFPAHASTASTANFLDRPIADEYTELLWAAIAATWPRLERKTRRFRIVPTHDADSPAKFAFMKGSALARSVAGDVLKRLDIRNALKHTWLRINSRRRIHPADPYNTFDWLMDLADRHQRASIFYFLAGRTNATFDGDYELGHPAIRNLLRKIRARGHKLGIHPSFETYRDPDALSLEVQKFRSICAEEDISLPEIECRMHYLRWETPTTLNVLENAGVDFDSTLGFADSAGFRCGTCHEFRAFDIGRTIPSTVTIRPLIAMETTVLSADYLGLKGDDVVSAFVSLKDACKTVSGNFTFLWHNSSLESPANRDVLATIIDG